jgi:fucose 4-O-acetylase-like acetyltransferase
LLEHNADDLCEEKNRIIPINRFIIIAGYISEINETLTLARTFFFFPFYLLGHFLEKKHFEWIKAKMNVWIFWIVLILLFVAVYLYGNIDWREWLYGQVPYEELMEGPITFGFLYKLLVYLIMGIATYCFLSIIPNKQLPITKISSVTLIIYLFHIFIVKYIHESFIYEWIKETEQYFILFILPLLIVYLLSRKTAFQLAFCLVGMKTKK